MNKISYKNFKTVMLEEVFHRLDLEIGFSIKDCKTYRGCWIGKALDEDTDREFYWIGFSQTESYPFQTFEEFANAKVFYGKQSLKDLWDKVSITSLNGGTCEEMLPYYLEKSAPIPQAV